MNNKPMIYCKNYECKIWDICQGSPECIDLIEATPIEAAKKQWEDLGDIPVDNLDCITESFICFERGTSKFYIWNWFEETYNISVAEDLMGVVV